MQVDWSVLAGHTLTSITGYQRWDNDVIVASDSTPQPVLSSDQQQVNEVVSQELRFSSPTGGTIEYIAGLYLYGQDTAFDTALTILDGANRVLPLPPALCAPPCRFTPGDSAFQHFEQETRSVAAFGSVTWYLDERWDVTAGLRWSRDDKDVTIAHLSAPGVRMPFPVVFASNPIGDLDRLDSNVSWSANTRYRFTDEVMGFITVATGFKSGGFNATRVAPGTPVEFEDEAAISYEAGIKSSWLDRRLQVNATLYWTELEDFQETSLNLQTGAGFIVANAGEQRNRGLEADILAMPLPQLSLNASVAYLDAEYTEYPNAQCGLGEAPDGPGGTCDRAGETPAFSPKWKYAVGAQWTQPVGATSLEWSLRGDYAWVDEQNLIRVTVDEPGNHDAYGLLSLRATLAERSGRWQLSAFIDNALDESYFVQAAGQPTAALMSGGGVLPASGFLGWYGPPRSWGLEVVWRPGQR